MPFLGENLLKLNFWYFGFSCIYRTKFDAFSDIDKFSIISKFPFFDIDKLPIISEIPIYRLSIIFHRYIVHPYPWSKLPNDCWCREAPRCNCPGVQISKCTFDVVFKIMSLETRGGRYIDEKLSKADKSAFLKLSATYRYRKMEIWNYRKIIDIGKGIKF